MTEVTSTKPTCPNASAPRPGDDSQFELSSDELVARLRECEAALSDQQSRLNTFAAVSGGWFWETDQDNRFTYFSPSVFDITGVKPEWHYGKTRQDIGVTPETLHPDAWEMHLETINNQQPFSDFVFFRAAPNGNKWMRTSGLPQFDLQNRFVGYRGTAQDITQEIENRRKAERLTEAIHGLDDSFVLWDSDDRLVLCNRRFQEINIRILEATVAGTKFEDHIKAGLKAGLFPDAIGQEKEWFERRMHHHKNPGTPIEIERQGGRWLLLTEQRFADGSIVTRSSDISEQKSLERSLRELASVDELTGVRNRRSFLEEAEARTSGKQSYGLMILDVDHFKSINDKYGHLVGDEALRHISKTLSEATGDNGVVGRLGGEEFVVMVNEANCLKTEQIAESMRLAVEKSPLASGLVKLNFTVSIGALTVQGGNLSLMDAMAAADKLLYRAKNTGRNKTIHQRHDSMVPARKSAAA